MDDNVLKLFYLSVIKRIIDFIISLILLIILFPLNVVLVGFIRLFLGSPILFRQQRPGKNANPFTLFKYRTMNNQHDSHGVLLNDSERLTQFGKFLRSTSMDELPSLINVLKGDMSLVGPRPLLMHYLNRYTFEQARRHEVKPGITGWAQVNGRNAISWEDKFRLDVWYVNNISIWLDIKILFMTVWKTINRADINQEGQATTLEFMGSGRDNLS
jgi:sugar transferase EpsL